jgi:type II secretory pathway component PulF
MAETETEIKKRNVGNAAVDAIRGGSSNEEALDAVKKEFPDAKTSMASINWYRNKLRAGGEKVKTAREIKKAAKEVAAKETAAKPDAAE